MAGSLTSPQPRREPRARRHGIAAALWGACLLLVVAAASLVLSGWANRAGTAETLRLSRLRLNAELLLTELKDVETGQRGYLVTGQPLFLDPYNDARPRVLPALERVLGGAGPDIAPVFAPLRDLVRQKLEVTAGSIQEARQGQLDAARSEVAQGEGKRVMDSIRSVIAGASDTIDRHSQAIQQRTRNLTVWALAVALGSAVGACLLVGATALINGRFSSEQLRLAEEDRMRALGTAALGSWEWDWRTDTVTASAAMLRIFDLPEDRSLTSGDLFAAVLPEDRQQAEALLRGAAGRDGCEWEGRVGAEGAPVRWVRLMAELYHADGRPTVLRGVVQDVTTRQEAVQRARNTEIELWHATRVSTVGEAATALAHELGQPLSAAATYLQGCKGLVHAEPPYDIADITEGIDSSCAALDRASSIVRNLQRFLRKEGLRRERIDLNDAVRDALRLGAIGFKAGQIVCEFADGLPPVLADRTQIQQVVVNLIRNAVEAMAKVGKPLLRISTALHDGEVIVTVADNGPGLAPDIASTPFRPFATTKPSGLGLGLSICRSIVEAHGGSIAVESGSNGATFAVQLPDIPQEQHAHAV